MSFTNLNNRKYHFVYKTTNLINQKIYIGIHSTDNINDNYIGSGQAMTNAIRKYGKENFYREILFFCKNREELLKKEQEIVSKEFVKNKNNYNLAEGGRGYLGEYIWGGDEVEELKKAFSKMFKGYKNPSFMKEWQHVYEELAPDACWYFCNTNLPDRFIRKIILKKTKISIKIPRLISYCEYKKYINILDKKIWKDYFGSGLVPGQKTTKTICSSETYKTNFINYKALHWDYLKDFKEIKNLLLDDTVSDSMIYNNLIKSNINQGIYSRIKYFKYLGIIKETGSKRINVRKRRPLSQRATGKKTIYNFIPISNLIGIENDGDYNEYNLSFDGETLSTVRLPDREYESWKIN